MEDCINVMKRRNRVSARYVVDGSMSILNYVSHNTSLESHDDPLSRKHLKSHLVITSYYNITCPFELTKKSSVVITGVPTKSYRLPTEWIQPNTTVINVASFKNVDEEAILQIPGVVYVPQVGKVTVAMLERNLMRLYEQFHHIDDTNVLQLMQEQESLENQQRVAYDQTIQQQKQEPWYGHPLNLYTASIVTFLFIMQLMKKK